MLHSTVFNNFHDFVMVKQYSNLKTKSIKYKTTWTPLGHWIQSCSENELVLARIFSPLNSFFKISQRCENNGVKEKPHSLHFTPRSVWLQLKSWAICHHTSQSHNVLYVAMASWNCFYSKIHFILCSCF